MGANKVRSTLLVLVLFPLAACTSGAGSPPAQTFAATAHAATSSAATAPAERLLGPGSWRTIEVAESDPGTDGHRAVLVYTPHVSAPHELPVLYLLHGLPGRASDLCNAASGRVLDAAFAAGARPFELACPDGNPVSSDDSEWANSADGRDHLETFVVTQTRRVVEGRYPRPASMRAIGGFSMGGFAAASLGLRHPALYRQVVCLAGYFHLDDPDGVFGVTAQSQAAHDPSALAASAEGQRWDLLQAQDDGLALTRRAAELFAPALGRAGALVRLATTPGTHATGWAIAQLGEVARFLSAGWARR